MTPALEGLRPQFILSKSGARLRTASFAPAPTRSRRGVCVLLHGQTEFIEKYGEVIDELRERGFAVVTFDWRGQGGSVRTLDDPLKAHVTDFAEFDDDLASVLEQLVEPLGGKPPFALAHSMGAHILLRNLHGHPGRFAGAVLTAPMLRISTRGQPQWAARAVMRIMQWTGRGSDWVWDMKARDPLTMTFENNLVTSDRGRFLRLQRALASQPQLRLTGPTWSWLDAAYRSMAEVTAPGFPESITTPLLLCGAGRDRICINDAVRPYARRLPQGNYIEFEDSEHEILMENDSIRSRFWKAFDAFVDRVI